MNVEDYNVEIPAGDMLETIFNHQRNLMDKYHSIEERNTGYRVPSSNYRQWLHAGALDINDRPSQLRMKDFAWRITEELTEATLSLGEANATHYLEEIIDALHFSVELMCLCGIGPSQLTSSRGMDRFELWFDVSRATSGLDARLYAYKVIEKLGETMNRLKLKPWKSTAMITDSQLFRNSLLGFWEALIDLLKVSGFTAKTATQMYLNKNAVNQFRIGSNY